MGTVNVREATDADRQRFAEMADTKRYPDAAPSRVKYVATAGGYETAWGAAVGRSAGTTVELLRVIPPAKRGDEAGSINAAMAATIEAAGMFRAIMYVPADQYVPVGWERGKSLYGKAGRYVTYSTDGKLKAEKPDDGRGIPRRT